MDSAGPVRPGRVAAGPGETLEESDRGRAAPVGKLPPPPGLPVDARGSPPPSTPARGRDSVDARAATLVSPVVRGVAGAPHTTSDASSLGAWSIEYADGVRLGGESRGVNRDAGVARRSVHPPYRSTEVLRRLGAYDLLQELGRGGMGVVYKAYSLKLSRFVAIKVVAAGPSASESDILRFHNEAILAARLKHPNIVCVFDSAEEDGQHYLVMELVEGGSLARYAKGELHAPDGADREDRHQQKAPSSVLPREILPVLAKVARALDFAHRKGVIHRDIKPDNILLDASLEPCITDFGVAKSAADSAGLTDEGAALGTPYYMPPEQAIGELAIIGPRSDVYALGATLYHVLAGAPPFTGPNAAVVLMQLLRKDPPPPSVVAKRLLGRHVPAELDTICLKALEKEVARRYDSAGALADDLERFIAGREIEARPLGRFQRVRRVLRRNRGAALGVLAVVCLLGTLSTSFGALAFESVERSTRSLVANELRDALEQADTIERAIRLNMVQGRADQTRILMRELNANPAVREIQIARTDRHLAYTDPATRLKVERRLSDPEVLDAIRRDRPDMLPAVDMVRRFAFPAIDKSLTPPEMVRVDRDAWNRMLQTRKNEHYEEMRGGVPWLVVLRPIENSRECQVCHREADPTGYTADPLRAVVVVRRSQGDLRRMVRGNRNATISVGAITASVLVALMLLFYKTFGSQTRRARARGLGGGGASATASAPTAPTHS